MRQTLGILILTIVSLSACKNKEDKNSGQNNQNIKMKTKEIENLEDIFIISHTFETDKKTLFNMWIDPETYTSWMGPTGAEMSFLNSDIKENGTALWQMTTPDQLTKYGKLHYKTINPNEQLVYVQSFSDKDGNFIKAPFSETYPDSLLLTADFVQEAENKVKMTVKWEIFSESTEIERKTFNEMKPYMVKGWNESFEKIEKLLNKKK
ncbi:SRPBCC domain-containing protein [Flavivirga aquimarina]|uniref:SRPBCC domain-containing protein n=1 Tax=Flavivirga aquimarina TaxID=2027862 RepID=A0ABT8W9E9_9FLAO|nr:SRPBCC domain-containing protein [Flavivirga aquimarina]MDO5969768.1 SRPBCC domain-containing protein [Flavivirga aquimarina]